MFSHVAGSLREIMSCLKGRSPLVLCGLGVGAIVPLLFILYTDQIWEDFLITYRFSENLARGNGLVFTPGERVHGFTSVFNTLLPAFVCWIANSADYRLPLFVYRILSLAALMIAFIAIISAISREEDSPRWRRWAIVLFPLFAVLEVKITAFTMNGQEAGFMLGFLAVAFSLAHAGWTRHWLVGGICFAGLMYTRPDGFVFILALGAAAFLFARENRAAVLLALARSAAIAFLLYLPWLITAWSYYGSPIPHTITAKKGLVAPPPITTGFALLGTLAGGISVAVERLCNTFGAIYNYVHLRWHGDWPKWTHDVSLIFELAAVSWWLVPTKDRLGRMASFVAFCILGYLSAAGVLTFTSPWYYPPLSFFSILTLVCIITALPSLLVRPKLGLAFSTVLALSLCAFLSFIFFFSTKALRLKQEVVDMGNRRALGEWLRQNVADSESVYLEPIGYIGYFSQRKIHDWPGLVSPTVVEARRKIGRPNYRWGEFLWGKVAEEIDPDWIVARPAEVDQIKHSPELAASYRLITAFDVSEAVIAAGIYPGSVVAQYDAIFYVFKRVSPASTPPATAPTGTEPSKPN